MTLVAEFIPGGGILPYARIDVIRLLHHHEASGTFIMVMEICFVFYILYFIFGQFAEMKKYRKKYWKSYWALAEWTVILLAIIGGVLYAYRSRLINTIIVFRQCHISQLSFSLIYGISG